MADQSSSITLRIPGTPDRAPSQRKPQFITITPPQTYRIAAARAAEAPPAVHKSEPDEVVEIEFEDGTRVWTSRERLCTELRHLQYAEDARQGVGKRSRRELAADYARRYTTEILDHADLTPVVSALPTRGTAALLCVERDPEACHRSLIAQRLAARHNVAIAHLRP